MVSPGRPPLRAMAADKPKGWMARCTRKVPVSTPKGGRVDATIARISRIKGAGGGDANELRWRNQDISRLEAKIKDWEQGWLRTGSQRWVCEEPTQPGSLPRVYDKKYRDAQIKWARDAIWMHHIEIANIIAHWTSGRADLDAP